MWNNPIHSLVVSIMMAAGLSLSACNNAKQDTTEPVASEQNVADVPTKENAPSNGDLDGAIAEGQPVVYDVPSWGTDKVTPLTVEELDGIRKTFGKVVSTDENSLDYASNPASKYRFMKADAPYLDVIDSEKYLEMGWYYANPMDSDTEKAMSKDHAKKSYKLARQLMGDEGGEVMADILGGQIIKNKTVGGQKIELAKCEFYSCMLVLNKSAAQADNS